MNLKLEELRKNISLIDSEIIQLLNARMEFAVRVKRLKKEVYDPAREKEVIENIKKKSAGLVAPEFSERLYGEIISESKRLQDRDQRLIAFQGEHGAYSEIAALEFDKNVVAIRCKEFSEVFSGVEKGQFDLGVVPVENSLAGSVSQVDDLLIETNLNVVGEVIVPIRHCLLALPETDYREIKSIYSHPQALSQCSGFLERNKLEPKPYYDTAGAAMMIANERPTASAAIASKLCAELYGLEVLKENIEDKNTNATRFLVLSMEKNKETGDKCSAIFSTAHKAGSLFQVLKIFSEANINLTRIESRPVKNDPGRYAFLVDFEGSDSDPAIAKAIKGVEKHTSMFKMLGCYKKADRKVNA